MDLFRKNEASMYTHPIWLMKWKWNTDCLHISRTKCWPRFGLREFTMTKSSFCLEIKHTIV